MEESSEHKIDEFIEIQIKDHQDEQGTTCYPSSNLYGLQDQSVPGVVSVPHYPSQTSPRMNYSQPTGYFQPGLDNFSGSLSKPQEPEIMLQDIVPVIITADENKILKLSKYLRYSALINTVADILFALTIPGLIVLLILNSLGYLGARMFKKYLCVIYCMYLGISVLIRILLMIFQPLVYIVVIYSLILVLEVMIIGLYGRFIITIAEIPFEIRNKLACYLRMSKPNLCYWHF